jgi:RpiB/LacA/LacB family sugar-phosphate isomerase
VNVIVSSDHVGFALKKAVLERLEMMGVSVVDAGPTNSETSVDYPDYAIEVAQAVSRGQYQRGVLICASGIGMAMTANRFPGVRAAVCHNLSQARLSRAHNDANVLCLGSKLVDPELVPEILAEWFDTDYEGGRHQQRLDKIENISQKPSGIPTPGPALPIGERTIYPFGFGVAISPQKTSFGPLLFSGRLEEGIRAIAQAGFQAVEISLRSSQDVEASHLQEILDDSGLTLAALATGQACVDAGLCLSASKTQILDKTIDHLKSIISFAAEFGAPVIIGGIRGKLTGFQADQAGQRRRAMEAVRECAEYASQMGITLLVEPINRYETNFINSSTDGMGFLEEIGASNVKLLMDTFHMNIEEVDLSNAFKKVADFLGYVHLADSNRLAPGQGHIDFVRVFRTLEEIGYQGLLTAEILPLPSDEVAMQETSEFLMALAGSSSRSNEANISDLGELPIASGNG